MTAPGLFGSTTRSFPHLRTTALLGAVYLGCAVPAAVANDLPAATLVMSGLLATPLVALSVVDLREFRLPDELTLAVGLIGFALSSAFGWRDFWGSIGAMAVGFGAFWATATLFRRMRGHDGLGLGDAKLLGACGAWVGLEGLPSVVLLGSIFAVVAVAAGRARGLAIGRSTRIPFGPFLGLACWIVWLYGALEP